MVCVNGLSIWTILRRMMIGERRAARLRLRLCLHVICAANLPKQACLG
jgi:hypothetical protein